MKIKFPSPSQWGMFAIAFICYRVIDDRLGITNAISLRLPF